MPVIKGLISADIKISKMVSGYNDITLIVKCINAITQDAKKKILNSRNLRLYINTTNKKLHSSVSGEAIKNSPLLAKIRSSIKSGSTVCVAASIKRTTSPMALKMPKTKMTISQPPML